MTGKISELMMARAVELSSECSVKTYPNPMVGTVIFNEQGNIIAEGKTSSYGGDHAEIDALRKINFNAVGLMMAVTLEPCNHFGKTPPCSHAVLKSGIRKVFIAKKEENGKACNGACFLIENGVAVEFMDEFAPEVEKINRFFFKTVRADRPWVTAKAAISKDGYITSAVGRKIHITGPDAQKHTHFLRASHMAIAVGANTVNIDNPQLTVREIEGDDPRPVIFSHGNQINPDSLVLQRDPVIITEPVIEKALRNLWKDYKINSILLEGGAGIISSFLNENMIDEFHIISSEKIFTQGLKLFDGKTQDLFSQQFTISEEKRLGEDILRIFKKK